MGPVSPKDSGKQDTALGKLVPLRGWRRSPGGEGASAGLQGAAGLGGESLGVSRVSVVLELQCGVGRRLPRACCRWLAEPLSAGRGGQWSAGLRQVGKLRPKSGALV